MDTAERQHSDAENDFEYPELGEEVFNLTPKELEDAWHMPVSPDYDERQVEEYFRSRFADSFQLIHQVKLDTPVGVRNRIDYIGLDKRGTLVEPVGFEIKRGSTCGYQKFGDFGNAIAQCIDYSKSPINDPRLPQFSGTTARYVFMFPCPFWIYEADNPKHVLRQRDMWAQGELKLAGKYGVGAVTHNTERRDWALLLGGHPAFWRSTGFTYLGLHHAKGDHWGSGR